VGIFLGVFLASRKGSKIDRILEPLNAFLLTIPVFWLALLFVIFFGIDLRLLPTGGAYAITPTIASVLIHMIMPLSVLVIANFPAYTIVMRNSALEVLSSDFVTAMRAQGLGRGTYLKRVIKNSMLPSITALFLSLGGVIGGVFTIEYVFAYPGVGSIIVGAIYARDYPVMQAVLFLVIVVVILANLAADLMYPLIDPRVSYVR
jgi:peptide/nickel transport system permease protein